MKEILNILDNCEVIDDSKHYWLVRTAGGSLYNDFKKQSLIAIGYPKIKIADIEYETDKNRKYSKNLLSKISEAYPDTERPGLIASQLLKFKNQIQKNDIVIIPSSSSRNLLIGEVIEDRIFKHSVVPFFARESEYEDEFNKCKKVRWLEEVNRKDISAYLYPMLFAHQAINSVNNYSSYIDSILHDFYKKGNMYNLILRIKHTENLNARNLFSTCSELLDYAEDYVQSNGIDDNSDNIELKINLNSPGDILLYATNPYVLGLIGLIIITFSLSGGKLEIAKQPFNLHVKTDGILSSVNKFLNDREDRKTKRLLREKVEMLKIEESKDIIKLLEMTDKTK